jgi:hypothetical protein
MITQKSILFTSSQDFEYAKMINNVTSIEHLKAFPHFINVKFGEKIVNDSNFNDCASVLSKNTIQKDLHLTMNTIKIVIISIIFAISQIKTFGKFVWQKYTFEYRRYFYCIDFEK